MNKEVDNLTKNEIGLLNELKDYCLHDIKSNDKFYLLCHLEDFVIKYYDLQQENKQLKARIDKAVKYLEEPNRDKFDISYSKMLEILKGE